MLKSGEDINGVDISDCTLRDEKDSTVRVSHTQQHTCLTNSDTDPHAFHVRLPNRGSLTIHMDNFHPALAKTAS